MRVPLQGFMGKTWDGGDIAARPEVWREVYRVLKPGAHLLAFGGTRTYHRMACAIEDAGFEIRDTIMWVYGSGFPESHDVSKGIDRAAGAKRDTSYKPNNGNAVYGASMGGGEWNAPRDPPVTAAARQWQGWGTALKPAIEPILLARKPLSEKTVATNVLKWGTGALNIGGCRIPTDEQFHVPQSDPHRRGQSAGEYCVSTRNTKRMHNAQRANIERTANLGRWPANLVHDGSAEVVARFPDLHGHGSTVHSTGAIKGMFKQGDNAKVLEQAGGESGSPARFFYTAEADQDTRLGSSTPQ